MHSFKYLIFFSIIVLSSTNAQAQSRINERFLMGTWDLNIDITEAMEEAEIEARASDSFVESIVLSTISGAITGLIDQIDISLEFKEGGKLEVIVDGFGSHETEYTNWSIDNKGRLIVDATQSFKTDLSEYWVRKGDIITLKDDDDGESKVYLTKRDYK